MTLSYTTAFLQGLATRVTGTSLVFVLGDTFCFFIKSVSGESSCLPFTHAI